MSPPKVAIEADSTESSSSDLDSIYSDETASITDTLATYVKKFREENGRTYHVYKEGEWIMPNDETQKEQMDLFHEIYTRTIGGRLVVAPIGSNPQRILDLGTGTGIWAMQVADEYRSAAVVGNDLSPIQPEWVPPNLTFEVDDFNEEWTYKPDSFDYVHARALHAAVTSWADFCKNAFRVTKPGGWFEVINEVVEIACDDGTSPKEGVLQEWVTNVHKSMDILGKPAINYTKLEEGMKDAGFDMATYKQEEFKIPIGTWPKSKAEKELGAMNLVNMLMGIEGFILRIYTGVLGKSVEETQAHIAEAKKSLKNRKQHIYFRLHVTYAQKPTAAA